MFNFQNVKNLIEERGLSQKEVCKAAGISVGTFYSFERIKGPGVDKLERLADVLHCRVDDFLDREVEPTQINVGHKVRGNGNNVSGDISLSECKKEVEHLKELLAEKERTIQILMSRQK